MAIDRDAEYLDGYADGRDGGGAAARFTGIGITETYRAGYRAGVEDRYQHGRRRDSENSESTNDSNETDSDDESAYSEATRESDFDSASSTYYTGSTSAHSTGAAISTGARDTFSEIIVIYIAYYSYVLPLLATLITIIHLGFIAGIHLVPICFIPGVNWLMLLNAAFISHTPNISIPAFKLLAAAGLLLPLVRIFR